jgi:hypothetical protein
VKKLKAALLAGDPIAREGELSADEAAAMRRAIVAAGDAAESETPSWPRPVFLAATVAATICLGIALGTRLPRVEPRADSSQAGAVAADSPRRSDGRRQLQFATPGGTRIIWVFDPEFNP